MGHEDCDALRPLVTPFFGQDDRDLTQLVERGAARTDPVILPTAIGFVAGPTGVTGLGHMLNQSAQMFAMRALPCPWHRKHIGIVFLRHQPQRLVGDLARIGHDDHLADPGWGDNVAQHLPEYEMLMPTDRGIDQTQRDRHTHGLPTRNSQDQFEAKHRWIMLTVTGDMAHGMLPVPLRFHRTVPNEIEHAIGWWWQRPQHRSGHVSQDRLRLPLARPHHPQRGPVFECGWQVRREPLERPCARIAHQRHQQPEADQKVLGLGTATMRLERVQRLRYFAWDACATPHVSRSCLFWDVGDIQHTQERFFFQGFSHVGMRLRGSHPSLLRILGVCLLRGNPSERIPYAAGRATTIITPRLSS